MNKILDTWPTRPFTTSDARRHAVPSPYGRRRREDGVVDVDLPIGEAVEQLVECDTPLEAGQGVAKAVTGFDAERDVLAQEVDEG